MVKTIVFAIIRLHHYHGEDYCFCQYYYTSAHVSGRRYYILLLKFLSFSSFFFLSPQDIRDGATDREPF